MTVSKCGDPQHRLNDNKAPSRFSPTARPRASLPASIPFNTAAVDVCIFTLKMAGQQQSEATTGSGIPPELNVLRRLQKGDRFAQTLDLRVATERCFFGR